MSDSRPTVVVIGGGITGLVAADELAAFHRVMLIEGSTEVGGKIRASEVGGLLVDEGAESFLSRRPEATRLAESLGLEVIHPAIASAGVLIDGTLRALPARTVFGIPGDLSTLKESGIFSASELAQVAAEPALPIDPMDGDVSVGELVAERMGQAVVDKLVDPLLGGVYAGRAANISLEAAAPALANQLRHGGSLTAAAQAVANGATGDGPVFGSVAGSLHELIAALRARLVRNGVELRVGRPATAVEASGAGWVVTVDGERVSADAVVVACPASPASKLLAGVAPGSARLLGQIEYASIAIATLIYEGQEAPSRTGSGYLVPAAPGRSTKAVTLLSRKWARTDDFGGSLVVRASVGRYGETEALQVDDDQLLLSVAGELEQDLGLTKPRATRLTRWGGALPQYAPGHVERTTPIRAGLPPTIAICGASLDGVGIPACIASARRAANETAFALLRESTHD